MALSCYQGGALRWMLGCLGLTTLVLLWTTLHDPHPQQPELQWSDPEAEKTQEALKAQIAMDIQRKMDEQNLWKNLDNIQNATLGVCLPLLSGDELQVN